MVDKNTPSRVFPLPGYTKDFTNHGGFNGGSDIFAPVGTPVVSVASGKVIFTSTQAQAPTSGGNSIEILGNDGLYYYYAHFRDAALLKVGDTVKAGQAIGFVDNTGNAAHTASHLHIGIGHGISEGVGSPGGLGQNFDAVSMLKALQKDTRSNDPTLIGQTPNPPDVHFIPSVSGFDSTHLNDIFLNMKEAIAAGIDPFLWLGIVSKESGFDPNAKNPSSGACGYAQIFPCLPSLTPVDNIREGIKRLKGFMSQCGGDVNCALNLYSGGAGQAYISDVNSRAAAIKTANPSIGTADPNFDPTIPDTPIASNSQHCPPIILHLGPIDVPFPDVGCIITTTLNDLQDQLANWFRTWQTEHVPNITFVVIGLILLVVGVLAMVSAKGGSIPMPSAKTAAKEIEETAVVAA